MATTAAQPPALASGDGPRRASGGHEPSEAAEGRAAVLTGPMRTLAAGGIAGAVSRTAVAPLERIKILFQVQGLSVPPGQQPRYTSLREALSDLWRREGMRGMFRGNAANCQRIVPQSAMQFLCFERFADLLFSSKISELTPLQRLVTGGLSGAASSTCTYPMEFVRARITVDFKGEYRGLWSGMRQVAATEGFLALYRGLLPSLFGIVPYIGVDFMVFGELRKRLADETGHVSIGAKLFAGGVAGICGQSAAYPLDTVRRILQVQDMGGGRKVADGNRRFSGMIDCMTHVVRKEGVRGLFRGYLPNLLKAGPSVAISFTMFEWANERLKAF